LGVQAGVENEIVNIKNKKPNINKDMQIIILPFVGFRNSFQSIIYTSNQLLFIFTEELLL